MKITSSWRLAGPCSNRIGPLGEMKFFPCSYGKFHPETEPVYRDEHFSYDHERFSRTPTEKLYIFLPGKRTKPFIWENLHPACQDPGTYCRDPQTQDNSNNLIRQFNTTHMREVTSRAGSYEQARIHPI